jgi:hypothetical protein
MDDEERLAYRKYDMEQGDSSLAALLGRSEVAHDRVVIPVYALRYLLAERSALIESERRIRDMKIESDICGIVIAELTDRLERLK